MIDIQRADEGFVLRAEQAFDAPLDRVFNFFADAYNLEKITPPWLKFRVETASPLTMREGLLIDYTIRLKFIHMRWQSEIEAWEPMVRFVDAQRVGPYRYWIHEHSFEVDGDRTLVRDRVHYDVPGGRLVNSAFVARDLRRIFSYRAEALAELFGNRKEGS